jgi:hypothetical protein
MKRNVGETRRRFLAFLGASPLSLASNRGEAQSLTQLKLSFYSLIPSVSKADRFFTDKVTENSAGTIRVSSEWLVLTLPFQKISKASALASYYVSEFASIEPVLGLSTLPMVAATFDEAETLARIARPYYTAALARHGQILLATGPRCRPRYGAPFPFAQAPTSTAFYSQYYPLPPTVSDGKELLSG